MEKDTKPVNEKSTGFLMNLNSECVEINDEDQERLYANIVIALFKSFNNKKIISNDEYKLLSREIHRTFNLF